MTRINIEEVQQLNKRIDEIRSLKLKDIKWYKNGIKLEIPEKAIKAFNFTGLCNDDFIEIEYYKPEVYNKEIEFLKDVI